jgi:ankyrin repeat protein
VNDKKHTALHIAAINGRTDNIKALLAAQPKIVNLIDNKRKVAFFYALKLGEIEPIKAFLDSGTVKINDEIGRSRFRPLHFAAAQGNYELVEFLLDRKGKVLAMDKFKRTPLIHAVKNGHVKVAALLLRHGSDWN